MLSGVKVEVTQTCPILCDPMSYTVHGILQARILEWVAFPFSRESSQPRFPTLQADSLPTELQGKLSGVVTVSKTCKPLPLIFKAMYFQIPQKPLPLIFQTMYFQTPQTFCT